MVDEKGAAEPFGVSAGNAILSGSPPVTATRYDASAVSTSGFFQRKYT
ncbi:MAG: hypothetical protein AABY85_00460 [Gemmatimonadota bacterium]|jgi:hypothetical protein